MTPQDAFNPDLLAELEALRESEQAYRTLAEHVPSVLMRFDRHQRVIYLSPNAAQATGLPSQSFLGKTNREMGMPPELCDRWEVAIDEVFRTAQVVAIEFDLPDPAARPRTFYLKLAPEVGSEGVVHHVVGISTEITKRRRAEEAARAAHDQFVETVESLSDGLVALDHDWRFTYVNRRAATNVGFEAKDLLGRNIWEAFPALVGTRQEEAHRRAMAEHVPVTIEVAGRVTPSWYRLSISPTTQGVSVIWTDITERKRAEEALREQDERSRSILENMSEGLMLFDAKGDLTYQNPASLRIHGFEPHEDARIEGEVLKATWKGWDDKGRPLPPDEWPMSRVLRHGRFQNQVLRAQRVETGREFYASYNGCPIYDSSGALAFGFITIRDITEEVRAEEALREANARLAENDSRKDEFLAILSHELRNPLAPIRYALPVLQRERLGHPAGRALAVIDRQVEHLTRLVDDLLDVSRITRGKIELRPEHVTLGAVINAAVEAASPVIAAARHAFDIVVPDEPIWLHADAARVAQVVTNLLNNSAKYTPRGGRITLEAHQEQDTVVIAVRDNGMGIPPDALPTVFDMFRQVNHPDQSQGGLGIGLGLVKRLVEMHGGTIQAHSAGVGQGATFVVRLPVAKDAEPVAVRPSQEALAAGRRLKVLIVDDNPDLVEMLGLVVEAAGHEVRKALDGRSALSAALSYRPDVVLLDLGLPVMGGIAVARELRGRPETAHVRLVALTGRGQTEDRHQTEAAGFDEHLTKPTDPQRLERLLAQFAREWRPPEKA